jgi:hypothetical protein
VWKDYLEIRVSSSKRGVGLADGLTKIATGESAGRRTYSGSHPDKTDWDEGDHFARFVYMVRHENETDADGVFYNKGNSTEWNEYLVWQVLKHIM